MRSNRLIGTLSSAFLIAALGCGPAEQIDEAVIDANASVSIDQPMTLSCVGAGCDLSNPVDEFTVETSVVLDRAIEKIELFVGDSTTAAATGTSQSFTWNTINAGSGLVNIFVRVTDEHGFTYDSPTQQVVVVNLLSGAGVRFLGGTTFGTLTIPINYTTEEVDARFHWDNPTGNTKIIAVARWEVPEGQEAWNLGVAMGCGVCPHNGTTWGPEIVANTSPIVNVITPDMLNPPEATFANDQAFVHIRPDNAVDHKGEQLDFQVNVYTFTD